MSFLRAAVFVAAISMPPCAAAQFSGLDVGAPALAGETRVVGAGSAYDLTAAGSDIYATSDQFHFAYRVQNGDFDLRVRVTSLAAVHPWSKAGLMARESMDAGSRQVSVFATPAGGYEFQHRASAGAFVQKVDSTAKVSYPNTWVRLRRVGNEFSAYTSADGASWSALGPAVTVALPKAVFIGMAATSHDASQAVLAQFRDLGAAEQAGVDVGAPALAGQTRVLTPGSAYDVTAAGSDIFAAADQFHFAFRSQGEDFDPYRLQSGDFDLRVRVASLTAADAWSKAGLMARESMDPGSRHVSVFATPAAGYEFQLRPAAGALAQKLDSTAKVSYPNTWVRLRRVNNDFSAYTSSDGVNWEGLGAATLAMPRSLFLGMAATSHKTGKGILAQFRDLAALAAPSDTAAPSVPAGLSAVALSASQVQLTWNASSDNTAVTGYRVRRNGVDIATSGAPGYTDAGLLPATLYAYTVAAFDAAGNVSPQSLPAVATTPLPPDTAAPSVPAGLSATAISSSQINLAWQGSTDNVGVAGYRVLRGGVQIAATLALTYADTGLSPATLYSYSVVAFDAAGNASAPSMSVSSATQSMPDLAAPSTPAGLSAAAVSSSQINLAWSASSDNVGVASYRVLRGGVLIGGTSALSFADTNLAAGTTYSYAVAAVDAAGNVSASAAASATTGPAAPSNPAQLKSPLGTNLEAVTYWSPQVPFVDVMKSSSDWGTNDGKPLDLDANGYVRSLAPGQTAHKVLLREMGGRYPGGVYVVRYKGEGTLSFRFDAKVLSQSPGEMLVQVTPSDGGVWAQIDATNPANYLRDIEMLLPGGICEGDPFAHITAPADCGTRRYIAFGEDRSLLFNPVFAARLRSYSVLRFMDWMSTNHTPLKTWSQRPLLSYHTWYTANGVPLEAMIALANLLSAHPWFTIPHQADDDYSRNLAQLVSQQLDPSLAVYVEHSNEIWNTIFAAYNYVNQQGAAQTPKIDGLQYHALRTRTIAGIFKAALGERVVAVLGAQAANPWTATQALNYLKSLYGSALGIDAVAIAPYFGVIPGPATAGTYTAMTLDAFFDKVRSSMLPESLAWVQNYRSVAATYGVRLISYEGGQHMVGGGGAENDAALNDLFDAFNRDARMKQLYLDYLAGWKQAGGELFVHFTDVGRYTKWGRWGALEYIAQPRAQSPKFDAIQTFIEQNPVWWTQ